MSTASLASPHLNRVSANANPRWKKLALAVVKRLARHQKHFTTGTVLQKLARYPRTKTHDLRAIGPIMVEARDLGIIKSCGLVRRNDSHTRGATVLWKSCRYKHPVVPDNSASTQPPPAE